MVQLLWKTEWRFHKKLDTELPNDLTIPLWGIYIYQKNLTQDLKTLAPSCSLQHYSQQPRHGNNSSVHQWIKKMLTHTHPYTQQ